MVFINECFLEVTIESWLREIPNLQTEIRSDAQTNLVLRSWIKLALLANFVELL